VFYYRSSAAFKDEFNPINGFPSAAAFLRWDWQFNSAIISHEKAVPRG